MIGDTIPEGYSTASLQNFTPKQMKLFKRNFKNVGKNSYLSKLAGGDQSFYDEIEAPALRQFSGIQGNIASRFSGGGGGQGAMSSRRSSGFQNEMSGAASDFAQDLQSRRQSLQRQALLDLQDISQQLMGQRPRDRSLVQRPQEDDSGSGWGGLIGAGLGAGAGFFAGGPAGAMTGAKLGQSIGSSF